MVFSRLNGRWEMLCCFFIYLVVICISSSGHDLQRVGQLLVGLLCLCFLWRKRSKDDSFFREPSCCILIILFLAVFSAMGSRQPTWAFVEISVVIVGIFISLAFFKARVCEGEEFDRWFLWFLIFLCAAKGSQFFIVLVSFFGEESKHLDTDLFIEGFSNKRFYGQFQTFTLPLLALPLLLTITRRFSQIGVFSLLSLWWLIAITGGTRGTWLGMSVAACVLFIAGRSGRRWITWQIPAVATGIALYWLLFSVLTDYLGIEVSHFAGDRLTTSLSGRGPLWQQAWEMIRERPLLGFGPMHFADIHNSIAAHPHQAILQWASEWGIPSTLLVMWLVGRGLWATFRLIRERANSNDPVDLLRVCLFASLIGALTQSMVDGVIVMPYSQLWLSLVVGWLMGIHVWKGEPTEASALIQRSWMGISTGAVLLLVYIAIRDGPHLDERNKLYQEQYGGHFQPRFWTQGVIAIKPG
ncbi:pilus assembly protein [Pseudomonas agarici]|uniref:Pilus assembly protein n=1 Tax=Pseudomonas agarici TaxID=46677 RepID=A0A0X1T420_PSEAA|nr:O-antigen ligase family protein [Pseudomonas agarici]AMB86770.1 pilus assembly protein [Pseudomonas agarici]NWC08579.1 O-antigen ligase family protein [Pseudomonas agarici]